jgi:peptidoglycan glycosyltransferase
MALVAAGIANGGGIMRPWLVGSMATPRATRSGGSSRGSGGGRCGRRRRRRGADDDLGGAPGRRRARRRSPGVEVGAKTGTAEAAEGQEPHAWFIGFAGRYAVAVVLDNAGGGGANALPVGRELLRAAVGAAG